MALIETIRLPYPEQGSATVVIGAWAVSVGDTVATGQPLVEVATGSGTLMLSAQHHGVLTALLVHPGDTVGVGDPIAILEPVAGNQPPGPPASLFGSVADPVLLADDGGPYGVYGEGQRPRKLADDESGEAPRRRARKRTPPA